MSQIVLTGGRIIDPGKGRDKVTDLLIDGGVIEKFGDAEEWLLRFGEAQVIDCRDMLIVPGLIDMHVHFRTPGQEYKETLGSGSLAALAGGFTSVVCMANTTPVIDNADILQKILIEMETLDLINIYQVSAMTESLKGREPVDFIELNKAGAIAFSDDGKAIQDPALLSEIIVECSDKNFPVILHCEDYRFNPYDRRSEIHYVSFVLKIIEGLCCNVHLQHISCAESVQLIREAKERGVKATCETAPHYFSLTKEQLHKIGANAKMNPPLRSERDRQALIEGVIDGTIDVIASDHAPHTPEEKSVDLKDAPFGVIGLETEVAVVFNTFNNYLKRGDISFSDLIAKMTIKPAQILGLDTKENGRKSMIELGYPADVTVINPKRRKKVDINEFQSNSRNCPWAGMRLEGWPIMTIKDGQIVMKNGNVLV